MAIGTGISLLQLGEFIFDSRNGVAYELTGEKTNLLDQNAACGGSNIDSIDLTYAVYVSGYCTTADAEDIRDRIQTELNKAPNVTLTRRATPTANIYRNKIRKGTIDLDSSKVRMLFAGNRTLALILSVTIAGTGAGNQMFDHARYLAATGAFNWPDAGDDVRALLYLEDSTVPDELYVASLDTFVDLDEATAAGYARAMITGRDVVEGAEVELVLDDPTFTLATDVRQVVGVLLYQHHGADSANIPLFNIQDFDAFDGGGVPKTIHINLAGLF